MKDTKKGEICQFRICHTIFRYICAASVHFSKNTIGGLKQQETSENNLLMVWERDFVLTKVLKIPELLVMKRPHKLPDLTKVSFGRFTDRYFWCIIFWILRKGFPPNHFKATLR